MVQPDVTKFPVHEDLAPNIGSTESTPKFTWDVVLTDGRVYQIQGHNCTVVNDVIIILDRKSVAVFVAPSTSVNFVRMTN
jgi:hypothetical protein